MVRCQLAARLMVRLASFCFRRKTVEDTVHWNELETDGTFMDNRRSLLIGAVFNFDMI